MAQHLLRSSFALALAIGLPACGGKGDDQPPAGPAPAACDPAGRTLGDITAPSPLVSVGAHVTASAGVEGPERAVDGLYHQNGPARLGMPTKDEPAWIAIELDGEYSRLLLSWDDPGFGNYDNIAEAPLDYMLETSANSTDGEGGDWTNVASVTKNPVRARAHAFDFRDQHWVRLTVTAGHDKDVGIDEISLFDLSEADHERPADTWFFVGDSITAGAFQRTYGLGNFDARIHKALPDYTPAMINGGIGGELATGGRGRLDQLLELNPDFTFIGIGYGTNDSWGNQHVEQTSFESAMTDIVDRVLAAGRIPVLARIPYATMAHETLPEFNAVIDRLTRERGLPCGPDLYAHFKKAQEEELNTDGVHPNSSGYSQMNGVWAEAALPLYPALEP